MAALSCPRCRSTHVRPSSRQGAVEMALSYAYVYPFRCQICRSRFRRFRPGERYVPVKLDRRDFERLSCDIWTALAWREWRSQGRVVDISIAGCSLETDATIQVGELVALMMEPEDVPPVVVDVAEVRSVVNGRVGLKFVKMEHEHEERLADLVTSLLTSPKRPK